MKRERLRELLDSLSRIKIGVIGDYCLDAYWILDESHVEHSVETGKPIRAVREHCYTLGGAGNVVNNLVALGAAEVFSFGVVGDDLFGRELSARLCELGRVNSDGLIVQNEDWSTYVFGKPHVEGAEQRRMDFGCFNRVAEATETALLDKLDELLPELDGLIINQQVPRGIYTERLISRMDRLAAGHPDKVVLLDARDVSDRFINVVYKANAWEAARLCGYKTDSSAAIPETEVKDCAHRIQGRTGRAVIITRGERGMVGYDGERFCSVPGIQTIGSIDTVGAGDTSSAALVCALSAGAGLDEAMELANFAAAVSVRKIRTTGTASGREILRVSGDCNYIHCPELAADISLADYHRESEIEVVAPKPGPRSVSHVIFDQDGTLSTLRQGWEEIMEPCMVRAILGDPCSDAAPGICEKVVERVHDYIDQSTGIETIVQMEALVGMVAEFGLVPEASILDALGYKGIYSQQLQGMVRKRLARLLSGELAPEDCVVKGSIDFLRELRRRKMTLYLASGSDHDEVVSEAEALGYAEYFNGGIYGWAGPGTGSAKEKVIKGILARSDFSGDELACFGDGPVELRLVKRCGGLAVGVASDEVRRWGLNRPKRARLIRAGADIIVPDYSQADILLPLVFKD